MTNVKNLLDLVNASNHNKEKIDRKTYEMYQSYASDSAEN